MLIFIFIVGAVALYLFFDTNSYKKQQVPLKTSALAKYVNNYMIEQINKAIEKRDNTLSNKEIGLISLQNTAQNFNMQSKSLSLKYDISEVDVLNTINFCKERIKTTYCVFVN